MQADYTHVTLVVDRSGSMDSVRSDAEGGVNTLLEEQKKLPGRCSLALYEFNHNFRTVYEGDIQHIERYHLIPDGNTALLDAMGKAMVLTGEFLSAKPEGERPAHVVFVVTTDGYENASREWTNDKIKAKVAEQEKTYGWQFIFTAANPDAFATGQMMGVHNSSSYAPTGQSTNSMFAASNTAVTNVRSGKAIGNIADLVAEEEAKAEATPAP